MSAPEKLTLSGGRGARRWPKRLAVLTLLALPITAAAVVAVIVASSRATLTPSNHALATLKLPTGGATVSNVAATGGREQKVIGVKLIGDEIWPTQQIPTGERVSLDVTVKRPGWNAWLAGSHQRIRLAVTTPKATLLSAYVTVPSGQDMTLHYSEPVALFGNGATNTTPAVSALGTPEAAVSLKPGGTAGTMEVAAAPRSWEIPARQAVSWFPAGTAATAVATPAPGTSIRPQSPITLTFSRPVSAALDNSLPAVSPAGSGSWRTLDSHTIEFIPRGYGYGLGARVQIALPSAVHLIGGTGDPIGTWQVPTGSTLRLQQLLATLGYLPVSWTGTGTPVADDLDAQELAAVSAPAGSFAWRYPNTPAALRGQWQPGSYDELTSAAVMSFENASGLATDGVDGPSVWKALLQAVLQHQTNSFGYSFVLVHEASSGETETTWHNGQTVVSGQVNTGLSAAGGTAPGVFAVFEHLRSTTMTGTNPDGSKYSDPNIPWVSYFDRGDALHGFIRASYGFPQSDGCVEMPYSEAGQVWPYTPIGTVVDVSTA